jgi:hypothetical protein
MAVLRDSWHSIEGRVKFAIRRLFAHTTFHGGRAAREMMVEVPDGIRPARTLYPNVRVESK